MGKGGEAYFLETQLGDTTCSIVGIFFDVSIHLTHHRQLEAQQYTQALALIDTLLTELKRLDDKLILTEVHLLESRVYRGIGNLAKAKVRVIFVCIVVAKRQ